MKDNILKNSELCRRPLPPWLRKRFRETEQVLRLKRELRRAKLHTVCQSAGCPNIAECFEKPTATFMILGDVCTRSCRFCGVKKGKPKSVDHGEPERIAEMARILGLKHIVITSVTRDDLEDGGAEHFARCVNEIHHTCPEATVEVLIPDFMGKTDSLAVVMNSRPDILNHNVETVPRLYSKIRPEADFKRSLNILKESKEINPEIITKSGLMVGIGESRDEVISVMKLLHDVECDVVTIGQYLAPSTKSYPVHEYIDPAVFSEYENIGKQIGIRWIYAGPYVRSSYNAEELMKELKEIRVE